MAKSKEAVIWGIHGGRTGDADSLFLRRNVIALGWDEMGDLSKLTADREAFKAAVATAYPDRRPMAVANKAGQLYRFVHEMQVGDLIVYPSKQDREVHIGRVAGGYVYDQTHEPGYPNRRPVKWLISASRTRFTQGALYEIGAAMSFFRVSTFADEFRAAVEGKTPPPGAGSDETVGPVAEEIVESTRDFILKRLSQELKGHPLADFVAHLLGTMGYRTRISPEGPDGGVDIVAHKDELGFEPPIVKVQVKSSDGSIGEPVASSLYGKVGPNEFGLIVSLGTFTPQAKTFARSKTNLRLIDGRELVDLILTHYEQFDSRYKGLLPLKQVYVPEAIEEDN